MNDLFVLVLFVAAFIFYRFSFDKIVISDSDKIGLTITHFFLSCFAFLAGSAWYKLGC